jgi:MFS family permease
MAPFTTGRARRVSCAAVPADRSLRRILVAASVGTLFEWYDFYLYGTLAVFFGELFFPPGNERAALLASLATFGAGFGVRPLGALVFGRIGDRIGRKYTFLVTLLTMGLSTALIGFLPTYASIGFAAPVLLVSLRLIQGLALGGEYGGAATYVAEHVPDASRGFYTSFIQTTATLGFFLSLGVIGATRLGFGPEGFRSVGWRVPFLLSFVLLGVSLWIRLRMRESPLFTKLRDAGQVAKSPLRESFTNPTNLKYVLIALFGATAGQGVVWYTGQFYALTFLQKPLNLDWTLAYPLVAVALAIGTPFFLVFGWLSDRFGRKRIMLSGCALAALTYVPIYVAIQRLANPELAPSVTALSPAAAAGIIALLTVQMVYVAMVYGPIAAFLVELFPTRIRYTSMSLPYHLGNGWFGGFLPLIATATTTSAWAAAHFGRYAIFTGLLYPIVVCAATVLIGGLLIRETKDHKIDTPV